MTNDPFTLNPFERLARMNTFSTGAHTVLSLNWSIFLLSDALAADAVGHGGILL